MSKNFRTQDYFRYKRLGKRWRRPKGLHSKLRKGKSGSGKKPAIGRKKHARIMLAAVRSIKELEALEKNAVIMVSGKVGTKKAAIILKKATELGFKVQNENKIKRSEFLIKKKQEARKKARKEKEEKKKSDEVKAKKEKAKKESEKKDKADVVKKKTKEKDKTEAKEPEKKKENLPTSVLGKNNGE